MNENEFFSWVGQLLSKFRKQTEETQEDARVATIFQNTFKPRLLQYLAENGGSPEINFKREEIVKEPCNYDIRICMDDETENACLVQGYLYLEDSSTPDTLVFINRNNHD